MLRITTVMLQCWAWFNSSSPQAQQKVLEFPFRWRDQMAEPQLCPKASARNSPLA